MKPSFVAGFAPIVKDAAASKACRLLVGPKEELWGQTVARLLSPEGILVGIVHTPWMHEAR